jgi:cell division protease FtsH
VRPSLCDLVGIAVISTASLAAIILLAASGPSSAASQTLTLSQVARGIRQSSITSIEVDGSQGLAVDILGTPHPFEVGAHTNLLRALSDFGVSPEQLLNVYYTVRDPPPAAEWWSMLLTLLPTSVLGALVIFSVRAAGDSGSHKLLKLTKHHAKRFVGSQQSISFVGVAGVDEAKSELDELVQFLTHPYKFYDLGAKCPHGVLLVGPPGTGKTLLARAVAGEANVPFYSICGSEFVEIVAGVGASRVRDLFDDARRTAPCILFVDEIDAIGHRRGLGAGSGTSECEQALNQLLVEMDGFDSTANVIVIAATNRADMLDPALLRPGRFDRHILVPPPDCAGRKAILEVHARDKPLDAAVDLGYVARLTPGLSGADLAQIMNEGAILAVRGGKTAIGMLEVHGAIERLLIGQEIRSRFIPPATRARRAYHEAGRALTIRFLQHHPRVSRVTIVPHSRTDTFTHCVAVQESAILTQAQLADRLTAALAGPMAERMAFPEIASGDEPDISTATEIAEAMVKRYGMSQRLGPVALSSAAIPRTYSESTARIVDEEIRLLIDHASALALETLGLHRVALDKIAAALIESETLDGESLERLLPTAN